jgi:hypothetical protein
MPKSRSIIAIEKAEKARNIMIERNKLYACSDENMHTKIMEILFPSGTYLSNFENIARYKYISYIVDKLCRYRINLEEDNLLDLMNYAALLAAFDEQQKGERET